MGPIEIIIRRSIFVKGEFPTPTGKSSFIVTGIDDAGVKISKIAQRITWEELESVRQYMNSRGNIIQIGATKGEAKPDTLEDCLRQINCGKTMKASYAASILEAARIVQTLPPTMSSKAMRIRLLI